MASISLRHIFKEYPRSAKEKKQEQEKNISPFAVRDFNLEIQDGEFVVLVGPSGCGKSTTLRMIAGLEDISGGELYIGDVLSNNVDASKRNIAMVFQSYALYPHMTSYGNMAYGLKIRKVAMPVYVDELPQIKKVKAGKKTYLPACNLTAPEGKEFKCWSINGEEFQPGDEVVSPVTAELVPVWEDFDPYRPKQEERQVVYFKKRHLTKKEIDEKIQKAAEILDIKHLLNRKPSEMSGGQSQRVALGRALVRDPQVFLLDEPLSNLDAKLRTSMRSEIVKLHNTVKTTFVYVTHDQVEAMTMGEKIVVMKDGVIKQVGTPTEIYDTPLNKFVAGFIGTPQMNFFDVTLQVTKGKVLITMPNGQEVSFKTIEMKKIKKEYLDGEEHGVILGVRGEHLSINKKQGVEAEVVFTEMLGNTTNILCKLMDSNIEFNISIQDRTTLQPGDRIFVSFEAKNIHFFDKETEETIYN